MSTGSPLAARERVAEMIMGCWRTQVIHEAVRLKLPDRLAAGASTSDELAVATGVDPASLYRLLRGLAALGLVRHLDARRFELTADGATLRSDVPDSLAGIARHWGERQWKSLGLLGRAVATGQSQMASGTDGFETLQRDPAQADVFNRAMAEQSQRIGEAVARAYDLSGYRAILDVGGGYGAVLAALLKVQPAARGASFDLPDVREGALRYLQEHGVADRASYIGGSFFDAVPEGYDCLVLKYIVHDWGDEHSRRILANCAAAVAPGGVVLLIEQVLPELITAEAPVAGMIRGDLIMMNIGGQERTEREYRQLLAESGLALARIVRTDTVFSVIEARPLPNGPESTT
jgi:SAM-dependent methyltransferase